MNMNQQFQDTIKKDRFPVSLFGIYLVVMLLMSGVHTGIIVFMGYAHWSKIAQTVIPIIYWTVAAVGLTLFTKKRVKETYEEPMVRLSQAAKQVAEGDFSVYVPTMHTMEKLDYLDMMILNFNKLVEELGSVETLKTDFVSNVSHEMKTPIAVIKNYAELLRQDNLPEEKRKEYGEIIEHAAVKLSALITNILRLNKLENQTITPERKNYDVCRQLCECILQFEDLWEEKNLELDVDIEDSAIAFADEHLMEIVWNNLLSNGIKFTEPGGNIKISQRTQNNVVSIEIADTGCGMSETNLKHIFDKFYQGDTSHSKEGNGLGLALVKRVLELMDGEIQIESELGKGSTFTVKIPGRKEE